MLSQELRFWNSHASQQCRLAELYYGLLISATEPMNRLKNEPITYLVFMNAEDTFGTVDDQGVDLLF